MKGAAKITVCLAIFVGSAVANTEVGPRIIPSCSSSLDLVLTVTEAGKPLHGVRVDLYRELDHGERSYWSGDTGPHGEVKLSQLSPGSYRVFADAGDYTGDMTLLVSNFRANAARCELRIGPKYSDIAGSPAPDEGKEISLRTFRGIVVDSKRVPIPHVIVTVFPSANAVGNVARFQSDDQGKFDLHLQKGSYIAFFAYQGFRAREMFFHLGNDGWQGCELELVAEGSKEHDLPGTEWNGAP